MVILNEDYDGKKCNKKKIKSAEADKKTAAGWVTACCCFCNQSEYFML
jgi:hypothetical protein